MTDLPYPDNDLRTEAARQHALSTEDPDFVGISERMDGARIESTVTDPEAPVTTVSGGRTWNMLARADFDKAHRAIDDLLGKAADVSEWAVDIGADGLEPLGSVLSMQTSTGPLARIHFAVRPDMPEDLRNALVEGLAMEIAKYLPQTD